MLLRMVGKFNKGFLDTTAIPHFITQSPGLYNVKHLVHTTNFVVLRLNFDVKTGVIGGYSGVSQIVAHKKVTKILTTKVVLSKTKGVLWHDLVHEI